ncbi:hypothetical protein QQ045_029741 [Rhodiola kirilowii]
MDSNKVGCLINSISRFILLVTSQAQKPLPTQNDFKKVTSSLKLLKRVLDEVADGKTPLDEDLIKVCEELDIVINEAREFVEDWSPKTSKICSVVWSYKLLNRIQDVSAKLCYIISRLSQSSWSTSDLTNVQTCLKEFQSVKMERLHELVEEALKNQRNKIALSPETVLQIIETLNLNSNQELVKESLAVEKERLKAQVSKTKNELDQINQIVDLLSYIREILLKLNCFETIDGVAIPPFFRCPLSLELMVNPMIIASGQTFEKTNIHKWLDQGLNICPKTRQVLPHLNYIANHSVETMIANWCKEKRLKLPEASRVVNVIVLPSSSGYVAKDLSSTDDSGLAFNCDGSTPESSTEVSNGLKQQKSYDSPECSVGESNSCENKGGDKFQDRCAEQSYTHSRSESAASEISSVGCSMPANEVQDVSSRNEITELSGEISSDQSVTPAKDLGIFPLLGERQYQSSKTMAETANKGSINCARVLSFPLSDNSNVDTVITTFQAEKLVGDLKSESNEVKTSAAAELRFLTKHNAENRVIAGRHGAIQPLLSLMYSEVKLTQEHAVTALLNLSLDEKNKVIIAESGALEPLIHVLETGSAGAKENSAAALFSLSMLEDYKAKIGRSGAIKALVNLLASGTIRGKKDAATALFNLSIFHENKARIVKAGAVKHLVGLMEPSTGMVDKSVALLANLATISEGCSAIVREGGIQSVVEVAEMGSQRGKENAACVLLQLCLENPKFCTLVLQEGAVPPLVAISQTGTPRAKEKAQQLLSHFRSQRDGKKGRN